MVQILYSIGLLVYLITVSMNYSDKAKASPWYFPAGMALALVSNSIWMYLAKHSANTNQVYVRGIIWDSMIIFAYSILPIFMYGVRFTIGQSIGVALILFGFGLLKFA